MKKARSFHKPIPKYWSRNRDNKFLTAISNWRHGSQGPVNGSYPFMRPLHFVEAPFSNSASPPQFSASVFQLNAKLDHGQANWRRSSPIWMLLKVKRGRHPTVRVAGRHRRRQRRSKRYTRLRMTVGWSTDFHLPRNLCTCIASPSPTWITRQKPNFFNTCSNVPENEGKRTSVRVLSQLAHMGSIYLRSLDCHIWDHGPDAGIPVHNQKDYKSKFEQANPSWM